MKIQTKPISKEFKLTADSDGKASVSVRQASTGQALQRGELFAESSRVWNDDEFGKIELKQKWNVHEVRRYEAYLTVTSITGIFDENEVPLFRTRKDDNGVEKLAMTKQEFFNAWDMLPTEVTREIHGYVIEINPQWDSSGE